jgi:16S rRNA (cytidine1402-2'-O)-methyltransferase
MLRQFGIDTPVSAYHEHNERQASERFVERMRLGESMALISDAGTPLISDPGFHIVRAVRAAGLRVIPIPGPSAILAALSASGVRCERFCFEGFLPSRPAQRRQRLECLRTEVRTLVFFEAPHRVVEAVSDLGDVFGAHRVAAVWRELTKLYEQSCVADLAAIKTWLEADATHRLGEFVLVVEGCEESTVDAASREQEARRCLSVMSNYLAPGKAAAATAELCGMTKKDVYRLALLQHAGDPEAPDETE